MLKGFKQGPNMLNIEGIRARIQKDLNEKRDRAAMELAGKQEKKDAPEEEKTEDPHELGEIEDTKRKFIVKFRPH